MDIEKEAVLLFVNKKNRKIQNYLEQWKTENVTRGLVFEK